MQPPPCVKPGQRLNACALEIHQERIEGLVYLPAEWWAGWRVRKQFLIGPAGVRYTARTLSALHTLYRGRIESGQPVMREMVGLPATEADAKAAHLRRRLKASP